MVRFFVSVIEIWCVCVIALVFFSVCSVPSVFCSCEFFSRVSVVLVRHTDGRKVQ